MVFLYVVPEEDDDEDDETCEIYMESPGMQSWRASWELPLIKEVL